MNLQRLYIPELIASAVLIAASTTSLAAINSSKIPVGDGKLSTTTPKVGYVYTCTIPNSPNPPGTAPWISADGKTWNSTAKVMVQGSVHWASSFKAQTSGSKLNITGNGLPSHTTGTFPIASSDPAHAYDGNPNAIKSVAVSWGLPSSPAVAKKPSCLGLGAIGILLSGARIFNALDADGRDAGAHEVQDSCDGHPQGAGKYHYHNLSRCLSDPAGSHSPLMGYIADGFALYGTRGENGVVLTNADLDICHGHTHAITTKGVTKTIYHYHATKEYPYTVGCFKGTPVSIN